MKRERRAKVKPDDRESGFDAWQARAAEILERKHKVRPGVIRYKVWRDLFISHVTPEDAAERAATGYQNRQTPKDRLRRK
jgi:hypothetical protein